MPSSRLLACSLLLAAPVLAAAQSGERPEVQAAAAKLQAQVVEWRRDFHQHPELSNREERTSAKVAEHLRRLGLKPRTGIARHGVVAVIKGGRPGPRIALRA
ncbi:amidohydrolase, partial [Xanthomonas sp. Kuri4-1]